MKFCCIRDRYLSCVFQKCRPCTILLGLGINNHFIVCLNDCSVNGIELTHSCYKVMYSTRNVRLYVSEWPTVRCWMALHCFEVKEPGSTFLPDNLPFFCLFGFLEGPEPVYQHLHCINTVASLKWMRRLYVYTCIYIYICIYTHIYIYTYMYTQYILLFKMNKQYSLMVTSILFYFSMFVYSLKSLPVMLLVTLVVKGTTEI